jgi:NAD-dependent DNA ligase
MATMNTKNISVPALVRRLTEAAYAYHNGLEETMTDAEYDVALEQLAALDPANPFLTKVGAPVIGGKDITLPIPLPSLNKVKPGGTLGKWLAKFPAPSYHISAKLDGCSALWFPEMKQLYTRGNGLQGRDIRSFVPYFQGFPSFTSSTHEVRAVRGELVMRTDSPLIPEGKLARNIVAGAINRDSLDKELFAEIRFVAYELVDPATRTPEEAFALLKTSGYEVVRAAVLTPGQMTEANLSTVFSQSEAKSPYQMDGIVVAPNVARASYPLSVRGGHIVNPADRVAWKNRVVDSTRTTTVKEVDWNISHLGYYIPRVLFEPVEVAGATISAATGLHGRWIFENEIGPGAVIEIRRAGDTIPQIVSVHQPSPSGPSMPAQFEWVPRTDATGIPPVHIRPVEGAGADELARVRLTHALRELGAENVGPGLIQRLYNAGFTTVGDVYNASVQDFQNLVEGCKGKMAQRIWDGLRAGKSEWKEINFLIASNTMPRGIGHRKLQPLLSIEPNPLHWTIATFTPPPPGLSSKSIAEIIEAIPFYEHWRFNNINAPLPSPPALPPASLPSASLPPTAKTDTAGPRYTVVLTGFRDKMLESALEAAGHTVSSSVSKKTTHVVYPDGPQPSSTKITKAEEIGSVAILPLSEFRLLL